ncbi:MAG: formate/nitrite transporter family protein [Candidatus Lokiarchaeota archaeon]|nr:formate/nitrite transporter family protein [Candidatus Lokiarchaeota archaeon]
MSKESALDPTVEAIANAGIGKCKQTFALNMVTGWNAGAWIAVGALLATITWGHFSTLNTNVATFMFAAVFPIGLIGIIFMGGADLFTGDCSITPFAGMTKKTTWSEVMRNWTCALSGNFIGSVCFAMIIALSLLYGTGVHAVKAVGIAEAKVNWGAFGGYGFYFMTYIFKGIVCNFLVNWAIWQAFKSNDNLMAKVVNIWFPIMAFVAVGSEHLIANMYFIPVGIFYGANVSWSQAFLVNFLPVLIGNVIGGYLFIGVNYWFNTGAKTIDDDPSAPRDDVKGIFRILEFLLPIIIMTTILAITLIAIPGLISLGIESLTGWLFPWYGTSGLISFLYLGNAVKAIILPIVLIVYFILAAIALRKIFRKVNLDIKLR